MSPFSDGRSLGIGKMPEPLLIGVVGAAGEGKSSPSCQNVQEDVQRFLTMIYNLNWRHRSINEQDGPDPVSGDLAKSGSRASFVPEVRGVEQDKMLLLKYETLVCGCRYSLANSEDRDSTWICSFAELLADTTKRQKTYELTIYT